MIKSSDENRDGLISREELPFHMHEAYLKSDANGDGQLDQQELLALVGEFRRNRLRPAGADPVNRPGQARSQ